MLEEICNDTTGEGMRDESAEEEDKEEREREKKGVLEFLCA